jgi:hypothetical protein
MKYPSSFFLSFFPPLVPLILLWISSSSRWTLPTPHDIGNIRSAPLLPPLGGGWGLAPPLDRGLVRSAPAPAPALGGGGGGGLHPCSTLTTMDPLLFSPPLLVHARLSFIPDGLDDLSTTSTSSTSLLASSSSSSSSS